MAIPLLAIGAGLGLLKGMTIDRDKENRQRQLAAATQRYSPWTGMQSGPVQEADPLGSALSFGLTGQGIQSGLEQQKLNEAITDRVKTNPWSPISIAASTNSNPTGMPINNYGQSSWGFAPNPHSRGYGY